MVEELLWVRPTLLWVRPTLLNESINPLKAPFLQERGLGRGLSSCVAD